MLVDKVNGTIQEYKNEGIFKKFFVGLGEFVGGVNADSVVSKILTAANEFINEAKDNPSHSRRQRFDASLLDLPKSLPVAMPMLMQQSTTLRRKLVDNADAREIIQSLLSRFKSTMTDQLRHNDTPFMTLLVNNVQRLLKELESDKTAQRN